MDKIHARNTHKSAMINCWLVRTFLPHPSGEARPADEVFSGHEIGEARAYLAQMTANGWRSEIAQSTDGGRWIARRSIELAPVPA